MPLMRGKFKVDKLQQATARIESDPSPKTVEQLAQADRIGAFEAMPQQPKRVITPPP
jgi:hypothetical protein